MQRSAPSENWFQASDFTETGRELVIDRAEPREIAPNVTKTVVFFRGEEKGLVLNEVNLRTIEHNTKISADDWDDWKGYNLTLYSTTIKGKEAPMPCIRIKILINEVARKSE